MGIHTALEQAADLIEQADALIIAAGAGMGIDSGLPDFRGKEGFWRAYPALRQAGLDFQSIASPASFKIESEIAWGFYGHRLALYRSTVPHAGFDLLKSWGEQMLQGYTVFTSNVDGQFQKAGLAAESVQECHGSIHHLQCLEPCCEHIWPANDFHPEVDEARCRLLSEPPTCPRCGGLARPNILMFGDWGWLEQRTAGQATRQDAWLVGLGSASRPLVIELGAGTAIPSVRHFSHRVIHEMGGRLIRINPAEAAVPTGLDVSLPLGALAGLEGIAALLVEP
ncbi:SIR2 family NAD-dependent protein deacylase [Roseateles oligotrophus]|uniref:protein acetyllysine N-acetyltransferase n=1 Tax=Roseateles oligotrophus TaxID=1769250 RepID=A0ABT2YCC5_9BURK|nr:Sir2 family NAD-dependent protein deacetylase [Roseateles oligotrophus]MCV2367681.1 NAD-dependent deacetylase [Roseateles oligotrophus]